MRSVLSLTLIAVLVANRGSAADTGASAYREGDFERAAKNFTTLADGGDRTAQNNLGVLYLQGRGVERDFERAHALFESAAAQGLAGAMFNLGIMNLRGYGQEKNGADAIRWFTESAQLGDREAQFFLGLMYSKGDDIELDLEQAKQWFERSAEAGLAPAQFNLAMLYLRDSELAGSEAQALKWLGLAAAHNHPGAKMHLAKLHLTHLDDPERTARAAELMRELADAGDQEGQMEFGLMHTFGHGVEKNPEEGRFWLVQSALQGHIAAQINLSAIYAQGIGTALDLVQACAWLSIAAERSTDAAAALQKLRTELDDEQRRQAEVLATELQAKTSRSEP